MQKATQGPLIGGQDESHTQIWLWRSGGCIFLGWLVVFLNDSTKLSPLLGLCRSVPRKKKPGGPQANRPLGSLHSCGKLVGAPRFPWKMPGCLWFAFLGKEQVVKVWTATVWQGFSAQRYILGKGTWQRGGALGGSLEQGKTSEQGGHRIHKTSPGGLGKWEQLSNTQTILSSKSPCKSVSVTPFGRWEHCASEARRLIRSLTGSKDRQELRFQVHPSASNLRLRFSLSPSLRFLEILR